MPKVLEACVEAADRVMSAPGYAFADLRAVLSECDRAWSSSLVNELLTELLDATGDNEARYFREVDLCGSGDFNLTLAMAGASELGPRVAASEFDMLVTNLSDAPLRIPVYRAQIDVDDVERRPGPLSPEHVVVAPYRTASFSAYRDIADIAGAASVATVLVVHSAPRGVMTWVFDRETLQPLNLTTTHLQASRLQLAIRVMGELGGEAEARRLETLARSEYVHFVRWEAAQVVYALDAERGARLLEEHLTRDHNAAIRAAARASLRNIAVASGHG